MFTRSMGELMDLIGVKYLDFLIQMSRGELHIGVPVNSSGESDECWEMDGDPICTVKITDSGYNLKVPRSAHCGNYTDTDMLIVAIGGFLRQGK